MPTDPVKKVGLLGGAFDPIHSGHLKAAEEVLERLGLEKIIFIPAQTPPHKTDQDLAPSEHRAAMVEIAIQDESRFECSRVELERDGPSYSIDTIELYSERCPHAELYFIIGTDQLEALDSWKDWGRLFDIANFIVVQRPGFKEEKDAALPLALRPYFRYYHADGRVVIFKHSGSKTLSFLKIDGIEVSSSHLRGSIKHGRSITGLVPRSVENYIVENKLYL